jgi:hypothetical protein
MGTLFNSNDTTIRVAPSGMVKIEVKIIFMDLDWSLLGCDCILAFLMCWSKMLPLEVSVLQRSG